MAETIIKYNRAKDNTRGGSNLVMGANVVGSVLSAINAENAKNGGEGSDGLWKNSNGTNSLVPKSSYNEAEGNDSVALGIETQTINEGELAIGQYNKATSGETLFTIGDGTDDINRHNVFEVTYSGATLNGDANVNGNLYSSKSVKSPIVSGQNATFNEGIFNSYLQSPKASITALTANGISAKTVDVSDKLKTDKLEAVSGFIKTLLSEEITVDYLTVTKAAHFFKLIIDEIKASQGQVIITPANAVIDRVDNISGGYRCYYRAKDDDGKEIYNCFEKNDQVVCQTFNAATGTSYNVSNTYYWRLVTNTGSTTVSINGTNRECHYFDLSSTDCDKGSGIPKVGDNCVQLGNRTDTTRQAAIVISAYNSEFLDKGLKAPSFVQYAGINDYDLSKHRLNIISNGLNQFKGSYNNNDGKNLETIISDGNKDLNNKITGLTKSLNDNVTDLTNKISSANTNISNLTTNLSNLTTDVNNKYNGLTLNINSVSGVVSSHTESISMLQQTDSALTSAISANTNSIGTISGNVASLTSTVGQHTTSIGSLSGTVTSHTNSISVLQQTASGLTNTVSAHTSSISSLSGTVTSHTASISTLSGDVKTNKNNITTLSGNVSTQSTYISNISGSVSSNTSSISSLQSNVNGLSNTVASHTTSIATLSGTVSSQGTDIGTLSGNVKTNTTNIANLQSTATGLTSTVSAHTESIKTINSNVSGLSGTVQSNTSAISNLQQTANGLTSTVASFSHSNLLMGSGDGFDWINYDETQVDFDDEWGGFNVKDCPVVVNSGTTAETTVHYYHIYSPLVYLIKDKTYTVSQYNDSNRKFTILWSTSKPTSAKKLYMTVTTIKDGTVDGDTWRGCNRYYQTFKCSANGWYCFRMTGTKEETLFYRPQLEEGTEVTAFNMAQLISESQIKQSADEISLKVQNCGIDIDSEHIILNGDTEVNGSLTLTDDDQGFILQGQNGTTTISPQSLGTYYNFQSKSYTNNSFYKSTNVYCGSAVAGGGTTTTFAVNTTYNLGTVKSGKNIALKYFSCTARRANSGDVPLTQTNQSHVFRVYQDNVLVSTYTATTNNVSSTFLTYTTTKQAEVKVNLVSTATVNITTLKNDKTPLLQVSQAYQVSIPTDAYTLLASDGLGLNFGTYNNVYFGAEGAYLKYGNYGLRINSEGLKKLDPNGSGNYVNLSHMKITTISTATSTYNLTDDDEFIIYTPTKQDVTVTLPTPSQHKGRVLYFKDGTDGAAIKISGYQRYANQNTASNQTYSCNNIPLMYICDGLAWNMFYCN